MKKPTYFIRYLWSDGDEHTIRFDEFQPAANFFIRVLQGENEYRTKSVDIIEMIDNPSDIDSRALEGCEVFRFDEKIEKYRWETVLLCSGHEELPKSPRPTRA